MTDIKNSTLSYNTDKIDKIYNPNKIENIDLKKNKKDDKNNLDISIQEYIEKNIEKKINLLFKDLPNNIQTKDKPVYNLTLLELYNGTLDTIIDIINDLTEIFEKRKYISDKIFKETLYNIFFDNKRKFYIGIIFVILSFILYFIDGSSI